MASEYLIKERWSQSSKQEINWINFPSKTDRLYLQDIQNSVYLPIHDIAFADFKPRLVKNREHFKNSSTTLFSQEKML